MKRWIVAGLLLLAPALAIAQVESSAGSSTSDRPTARRPARMEPKDAVNLASLFRDRARAIERVGSLPKPPMILGVIAGGTEEAATFQRAVEDARRLDHAFQSRLHDHPTQADLQRLARALVGHRPSSIGNIEVRGPVPSWMESADPQSRFVSVSWTNAWLMSIPVETPSGPVLYRAKWTKDDRYASSTFGMLLLNDVQDISLASLRQRLDPASRFYDELARRGSDATRRIRDDQDKRNEAADRMRTIDTLVQVKAPASVIVQAAAHRNPRAIGEPSIDAKHREEVDRLREIDRLDLALLTKLEAARTGSGSGSAAGGQPDAARGSSPAAAGPAPRTQPGILGGLLE
jgi:hypothetical protein